MLTNEQQEQVDATMTGIVKSMKKSYEDLGYSFVSQEKVIAMTINLIGHIDPIYREMGTRDNDGILLSYDGKSITIVSTVTHQVFYVSRDYNDDTWSLETTVIIRDRQLSTKVLIHLKDIELIMRSVVLGDPLDEMVIKKNKPKIREARWAEDISDVTIVCIDVDNDNY